MATFSIDEYKPLKVIVVGAGISGIYAGIRFVSRPTQRARLPDVHQLRYYRLRQKIQNLDLTIYEQNPEVGGTWWANRYP